MATLRDSQGYLVKQEIEAYYVDSSASSSSSGGSYSDGASDTDSWTSSMLADRDAELQYQESVRQLQLMLNLVLIPFTAKWLGRRWAYWGACELSLSLSRSRFLSLALVSVPDLCSCTAYTRYLTVGGGFKFLTAPF